MQCNRLQFNTRPRSSGAPQHEILQAWHVLQMTSSHSLLLFMIYLECDASMKSHVSKTVANCFAALRQIHWVWRSITRPVLLFQHWSCSDWTTVARCWPVCRPTYSTDYSQCSTLCCTAGPLYTETWPCDSIATWAKLATDATMDRLQARSPHSPLFVWSGAILPHWWWWTWFIALTKAFTIGVDERACDSTPASLDHRWSHLSSQWLLHESGALFHCPSSRCSHCLCSSDSSRLCCLPAVKTVNATYCLRRDPVFWIVLIFVQCPSSWLT